MEDFKTAVVAKGKLEPRDISEVKANFAFFVMSSFQFRKSPYE